MSKIMHIDKAIEILTIAVQETNRVSIHDLKDAQKLGIEALIRIRYQRRKPTVPHSTLLPSEDKPM